MFSDGRMLFIVKTRNVKIENVPQFLETNCVEPFLQCVLFSRPIFRFLLQHSE